MTNTPPPTDDQRHRAGDPATSAQELADLAAAYPELHQIITANPSAYDGLREWIASQRPAAPATPTPERKPSPFARLSKSALIAIAAAVAVVLIGGGTALAVVLTNSAAAPEAVATPTSMPTPTRTAKPTPTPKPTPALTQVTLEEPGSWSVYGTSLYRIVDYHTLQIATPGKAVVAYTIPDFEPALNENITERTDVTFTGPVDDLRFVSVGVQRTPAAGTTPEKFALVVISASTKGGSPAVTKLWDLTSGSPGVTIAGTSRAAAISLFQDKYDTAPRLAAGIDIETGAVLWQYAEGEPYVHPTVDTAFVVVDQTPDSFFSDCYTAYGVDTATGDVLFSSPTGACIYPNYASTFTLGYAIDESYYDFDRITGAPVLGSVYNYRYDPAAHIGVLGGDGSDLVFFDTTTGAATYTMPYDQVSALGLRVQSVWNGKVYATTTDAMIVLDARTGATLDDNVTWYPLLGVGGWTLYDDGLFTATPRPLS